MSRSWFFIVGLSLLALGTVAAIRSENPPPLIAATTPTPDGIVEWACPAGTVGRVECAFVAVPEDYDDPEIRHIEVFVARLAPPIATADAPIVYLGDNLGGVTVADFGDWQVVARQIQREVILVDQRGSGRSNPRIACPNLQNVRWLESDLRDGALDSVRAERVDGLRDCRDRLDADYPVTAYSVTAMANDLDRVRQMLGIDSWVLAAAGDASLIARTAAAQFPDTVESVVLLGTSSDTDDRRTLTYGGAKEVVNDALGTESLAALEDAAEPLQDRSIVFAVTANGRTERVSVNSEVVYPILARAVGDPEKLGALPALIDERMATGQWRPVATLRAQQYPLGDVWSVGVALSAHCGTDPSQTTATLVDVESESEARWAGLLDDPTLDPALCDVWSSPRRSRLSEPPSQPTLVVNGEYDLYAPRSAAESIETSWPAATVVTLVSTGRPSPFDPCVVSSLQAFLTRTPSNIDGECGGVRP